MQNNEIVAIEEVLFRTDSLKACTSSQPCSPRSRFDGRLGADLSVYLSEKRRI